MVQIILSSPFLLPLPLPKPLYIPHGSDNTQNELCVRGTKFFNFISHMVQIIPYGSASPSAVS